MMEIPSQEFQKVGDDRRRTTHVRRRRERGDPRRSRGHDGRDPYLRGNFKSTWLATVATTIAETVFSRLNVDAFFLEYDTDRAEASSPCAQSRRGKSSCSAWSARSPGVEKKET